jgi:hypothetical protein
VERFKGWVYLLRSCVPVSAPTRCILESPQFAAASALEASPASDCVFVRAIRVVLLRAGTHVAPRVLVHMRTTNKIEPSAQKKSGSQEGMGAARGVTR